MQTGQQPFSAGHLHDRAWADHYELIDCELCGNCLAAMDAMGPLAGHAVVDVGCGTGQTLVQLAERVGPCGNVTGVDIAPLLLGVAAQRTSGLQTIRLAEADAQALDLPSCSADAVFSRFGVMAFSDPGAAFANFKRVLKPGGRLAFCCWRALGENELDWFPLRAAGLSAAADATPFSLSDPSFIRNVLGSAGFVDIEIQPHDEMVSSGSLDAMATVLLSVGPLGKIVREAPELRADAELRLRAALAARGDDDRVELQASVWIVSASALA